MQRLNTTALPPAAQMAESNYLAIWIYLAILTALELVVAYAPVSKAVMIGLLTGLGCANALLVAMYFMHLRFDRPALGLIAIGPVLLVLFMIFTVLPAFSTRHYPRDRMGDGAWMISGLNHAVSGPNPNIKPSPVSP